MCAYTVTTIVCDRCHAEVPSGQHICRRCGASLGPQPKPVKPPWYEQRWTLLLVLFLGVGPIAIPPLWKSNAFGPAAKIALSVAVCLWTALIIGFSIWVVQLFVAGVRGLY